MASELYNLVFDVDECLSKLLVNIETLEQIQFELANIRQKLDLAGDEETLENKLSYPVIRILDDLLFYTLVDMNDNYETVSLLVEKIISRTIANLEN